MKISNSAQINVSIIRKLLYVGLGVKRWLLVGMLGVGVSAIGLAFIIKNLFGLVLPNIMPWYLEGFIIAGFGVSFILISGYGLFNSLRPFVFPDYDVNSLANTIYTRRSRGRGPKVVALGGGTGLSVLLRGLRGYTDNLSAVVTVADDGGSSGRLRKELSVLPPGDFRNCLVAMSDDESLVRDLFQYRFDQGDGLQGHSFGNLFIAAMTNVAGSFERAIHESSRVLAVHGRVLPATMENLNLSAYLEDGSIVHGESNIGEIVSPIDRVMINPEDPDAYPQSVEDIKNAELIVIGPGSLYTSIIPNLLISEIRSSLRVSTAVKIYVCNVAIQRGETDGYSVADHLQAIRDHTSMDIVDYVLVNNVFQDNDIDSDITLVIDDKISDANVRVVGADLVDSEQPFRHDSAKLAQSIIDMYYDNRKIV